MRLPGAQITGNLDLAGAALASPTGDALDATGVTLGGSLLAGRHDAGPDLAFCTTGRVLLAGSRIGGDLRLSGARIERGAGAPVPRSPTRWPRRAACPSSPAGSSTPRRASSPTGSRSTATSSSTTDCAPTAPCGCRTPSWAGTCGCPVRGSPARTRDRPARRRHGRRWRPRGPGQRPWPARLCRTAAPGRRPRPRQREPVGRRAVTARRIRAARRPVAHRRRVLPAPARVCRHHPAAERRDRGHARLPGRAARAPSAAPRRHCASLAGRARGDHRQGRAVLGALRRDRRGAGAGDGGPQVSAVRRRHTRHRRGGWGDPLRAQRVRPQHPRAGPAAQRSARRTGATRTGTGGYVRRFRSAMGRGRRRRSRRF